MNKNKLMNYKVYRPTATGDLDVLIEIKGHQKER
jgi:hypothetical protein